jgi:radical SAM protein with 4Fe4S-binding SPASM domain
MNPKIKSNLEKNPLFYTRAILLEISNLCNYSAIHPKCPISTFKEKVILPLNTIEKVLKELGELGFKGTIYPFNYSEPLIDPRLFKVLEMTKELVPLASPWLYTNGFMLNDEMVRELDEYGVKRLCVSIYTPEESKRIRGIIKRMRGEVRMELRAYRRYPMNIRMNDKMDWPDREPLNLKIPCPSPLRYLTIDSSGNLIICCHDFLKKHIFGNVKDETLAQVIRKEETIKAFEELSAGKREGWFLCARCTKHR